MLKFHMTLKVTTWIEQKCLSAQLSIDNSEAGKTKKISRIAYPGDSSSLVGVEPLEAKRRGGERGRGE